MELERCIVPFAIYNLAEAGYVYPTWCSLVSWMVYDANTYWSARPRDVMMLVHHAMSVFIAYWLLFFETDNLHLEWCRVAGLLELSGCATTVYTNISSRRYWDKMVMLSLYCPLRFWHVPKLLMELDAVGACRVPLTCVWFIVMISAWWVRRMFLSAFAETTIRLQPASTYLATF
jgi:hypothetical protein